CYTPTGLAVPGRRRERSQRPTNRANGARVGTQAKTPSPLSIKELLSNRATGPQGHCFLRGTVTGLLQPTLENTCPAFSACFHGGEPFGEQASPLAREAPKRGRLLCEPGVFPANGPGCTMPRTRPGSPRPGLG